MQNHKHKTPHACPFCNGALNAATSLTERNARPREGDISICLYCAAFLIFDADGLERKPTDAERVELEANTEACVARSAVIAHMKSQGGRA